MTQYEPTIALVRRTSAYARRGIWTALCLLMLGPFNSVAAQSLASPDSVDVTPGAVYAGSGFREWLLGAHYRDLWTTQIRVPVLDVGGFAGGLTPVSAHAGSQTTSLRLSGADGRLYQFRRVFKTPTATLPEPLQGTLIADILQDGASASNPLSTVLTTPLLEAAGVLHADPRLFVMPDDRALGEFREAFAGMLGTIEERPNEATDGRGGFGAAVRVIGPDRLFERIDNGPDDLVDDRAFLTARLVDILIGDRDRHRDNFRWALLEEEGTPRLWQPVSRDHDEAFVKLDGFALVLARRYYPQLVSFSPTFENTLNLNWHSREVDRRFLTGLDAAVWDSVASALQVRLTDQVIEEAARLMPPAMFAVGGNDLIDALKSRRNDLRVEAADYYSLLAQEVEIHGTNAAEIAEIVRVDDEYLDVAIRAVAEGSVPYLSRRFRATETHEIRINLWGGRDRVVVRGSGGVPITIRVIGGSGRDQLIDSTEAGGVHFYDAGDASEVELGPGSRIDTRSYDEWIGSDLDRYPPREWGKWTRPYPVLSLDSDYGVLVGGRFRHTRYGFRKAPFAYEIRGEAAYATGDGWGRAAIEADLRRANSNVGLTVGAEASGIDILRFHGYGNDTPINGASGVHKVELTQFTTQTRVNARLSDGVIAYAGPQLRYSATGNDRSLFFQAVEDTLYGSGRFGQAAVEAGLEIDRSGAPSVRGVGYAATLAAQITPGVWDVRTAFGGVRAEGSVYLRAPDSPRAPAFSMRLGGEKLLGDAPFQEAAYLGGRNNLRGWSSERFAGDALVFGSAELQFALARFRLMLPAQIGLVGFTDVGRVSFAGESPGGWHAGAGGGVWLAFLDRANAVSLMFASGGDDGLKILAGMGFGF